MSTNDVPQRRDVPLDGRPLDLRRTLDVLLVGQHDPCGRFDEHGFHRATRTPDGPASLVLRHDGDRVSAQAWGPGADWALERLPDLCGLADRPEDFAPEHPVVAALHSRFAGMRLARTWRVAELLTPIVLQQLVTWREAARAWGLLVREHGEPAPGPHGLALPPPSSLLARLPWWTWRSYGASRKHGETIARVHSRARRMEEAAQMDAAAAQARLQALRGIGPWTAAGAMIRGMGFPDAVPTGDIHLPHGVAYALAGIERSDDEEMLTLLEPFRGHRGRVIRLLLAGGPKPPRRGPKLAPRPLGW